MNSGAVTRRCIKINAIYSMDSMNHLSGKRAGRPLFESKQHQKNVLEFLKTQPQPCSFSTKLLVQKTGLSKRKVERALLALKRDRLILVETSNYRIAGGTSWVNRRFIQVAS